MPYSFFRSSSPGPCQLLIYLLSIFLFFSIINTFKSECVSKYCFKNNKLDNPRPITIKSYILIVGAR